MVKRVDGAQRELNVTLGVDMIENFQRYIGNVLHIHVFVDHDDALGEHSLTERPDGAHHFSSLSRIRFADRDNHQVVEDAFDGKIDVDQFGNGEPHERKKNAFDRFAHIGVFHGRLANDGGGIDRIFAMRDAGQVEYGVKIFEGIETGVIAEGTFGTEFVDIDVAFEDDFAAGGDFKGYRLTLHEFNGGGAEESGD